MTGKFHMSAPRKKPGARQAQKAKARDQLAARAARAADKVSTAREVAAAAAQESESGAEDVGVRRARPNTFEEEELRRGMIVRKFKELGSPPEAMWYGPAGTVKLIADWLELPGTVDRRPIRRTLVRHVAGESLATHSGGRTCSLTHGEALVAAEALQRGLSEEQSAFVASGWRAEKGTPPVSRSAVRIAFGNVYVSMCYHIVCVALTYYVVNTTQTRDGMLALLARDTEKRPPSHPHRVADLSPVRKGSEDLAFRYAPVDRFLLMSVN